MQKLTFILLMSVSLFSFADDLKPFVTSIQDTLNKIQNIHSGPYCAHYEGSGNGFDFQEYSAEPALRALCVAKLCPDWEKTSQRKLKENVFSPENQDLDKDLAALKPALKDMINVFAEFSKKKRELSEKILSGALPITSSLGLVTMSSLVSKALTSIPAKMVLDNELGISKSARQAIKNDTVGVFGQDDSSAYAEFLSKILKDSRATIGRLNEFGAPNRYKKQYPNLSYQQAISQDLNDTQDVINNSSQELKNIFQLTGLDREIAEIKKRADDPTRPFDEIEGQDIARITDSANQLIAISKFTKEDPNLPERITKKLFDISRRTDKGPKNHLAPILLPVSLDIEKKKISDIIMQSFSHKSSESDTLYQNCLSGISRSFLTLPTIKQKNVFMEKVPEFKSEFKRALKGKYSKVSTKILTDMIDSTSIYPPPSKENFLRESLNRIKSITERKNEIMKASEKNIVDVAIVDAIESSTFASDKEEVEKICKNLSFHPVRDNTISVLGGITVGSNSITNRDFGLGTLAHEFGHNVQHTLSVDKNISEESRRKQENVESCLVILHKDFFEKLKMYNQSVLPEKQDQRKPDHYLSEDYADLISALTAKNNNFICEFQPDGAAWSPMDATDKHSADLFRLFHVAIASGRMLPQECIQFLNTNKYKLKECL